MTGVSKPELRVALFTDFICPFCYVGFVRLEALRDHYDLKVNWCFVEIHPDNPAQGRPVADLGYSDQTWKDMMGALGEMAEQEGLEFIPHRMTTNSRRALLLAEAAKADGREIFYRLCRALFVAYFSEGRNIGDPGVLDQIARESGVSQQAQQSAFRDDRYAQRLKANLTEAARLGLTGTPTFVFGERILAGAVEVDALRAAAAEAAR